MGRTAAVGTAVAEHVVAALTRRRWRIAVVRFGEIAAPFRLRSRVARALASRAKPNLRSAPLGTAASVGLARGGR